MNELHNNNPENESNILAEALERHEIRSASGMTNWVNGLLALEIFLYLRLFYNDLTAMEWVLTCKTCEFRSVMILSYLDLIYLPFVIYLFYKRRRWGWILLFGTRLFAIIPSMIFYFTVLIPRNGFLLSFTVLLFDLLNIATVILLGRKDVFKLFNITERIRLLTITTTLALELLSWLPKLL